MRDKGFFWGKGVQGNFKQHGWGGQRYQYDNKSIHVVNLGKASPAAEPPSACNTLLWLLPEAGNNLKRFTVYFCFKKTTNHLPPPHLSSISV